MGKMIAVNDMGAVLASEEISVPDIVNILFTGIYNVMDSVIKTQEEDKQQQAREDMYDLFNLSASALLAALIPDKELRPDLTAEAIMQMENTIIDNKLKEMETDGLQETEETKKTEKVVYFKGREVTC